jgi:hypothetical protein
LEKGTNQLNNSAILVYISQKSKKNLKRAEFQRFFGILRAMRGEWGDYVLIFATL